MNDRPAQNQPAASQPAQNQGHPDANAGSAEIDAATRRLMSALDAMESAVEGRREADRDEDELATRIQALGADRSRLADELDGSMVKARRLERANREIADRLGSAIGTIRELLEDDAADDADEASESDDEDDDAQDDDDADSADDLSGDAAGDRK